MAKNNNLGDFLAGIANKIRGLLGTTDPINPQDFEDKIQSVYDKGFSEGGPTGITATDADVLAGKVFGSGGNAKSTGTMPNRSDVSRPTKYQATDGAHLYIWIPYGYCSNYDSNGHLIEQPFGSVASAIGLTAAKLLKGQTVLGITGTGTGTLQAGYSYRYANKYDSKAIAGSIFKKASSGKLAFAKSVSNLPMVIVGGGGDAHTNTQTIKIGSRTIATKAGTLGTVKKVTVSASANEEITVDGDYNGSQWFLAVL